MSAEANGGPPAIVQPQPVRESVQVAQAVTDDGVMRVVIMFHGPTGSDVHFVSGEDAEKIAAQLATLARFTKAGLQVPER